MSERSSEIDCQQAIRLLLQYLDNELEADDHAAIEKHLRGCRACYSRLEFESRLMKLIAEAGRENPSPGLRERIRRLTARY